MSTSILGRVWGALTGNKAASAASASEMLWLGPATATSPVWADASHPQAYAINTWVYACVGEIANAVAGARLVVDQRVKGEWEPAKEDHPLSILLEYINATDDQFTFLEEDASWLALYGNSIVRIARNDKRGVPTALQVLPPYTTRIIPGRGKKSGIIAGYEFTDSAGRKETFQDTDVIHTKLFGSTDTAFGQSPVQVLERVINTYSASDQFTYAFYRGGGLPTVVVVSEQSLNDTDVDQIRARYAEWAGQSGDKNRPLVMGKGASLHVPGVSPDAVTAHDLPVRLREEICAVLRVPPAIVGIYEYANYANSREQRKIFYGGPVNQYWQRIVGALNSQLAWQFGDDVRVRAETSHIAALQPDFIEISQAAERMLKTHSRDEVRQRLYGDAPIGGEYGGGFWGLMTEVQVASADGKPVGYAPPEPPKTSPMADAAAKALEKAAAVATKSIKDFDWQDAFAAAGAHAKSQPAPARPKVIQRRLSATARVALWKSFNAHADAEQKIILQGVREWYADLTAEVLRRLEASKALTGSRVKVPALEALLWERDWGVGKLRDKLPPRLAELMMRTGQRAVGVLQVGINFDLENPRIRALLDQRTRQMVTVNQTAQDACRKSLQDGLANGETFEDMRKRVLEWSATGSDAHAVNVARTETGVCANAAALEGYKQGGAAGKEWLSIVDLRSRPEHAAMDGTIVPIDALFNVDGTMCYGPGDDALGAAGVCQCRCTTAPVIESEMPRDDGTEPPTTFEPATPPTGPTEPVPIGEVDV